MEIRYCHAVDVLVKGTKGSTYMHSFGAGDCDSATGAIDTLPSEGETLTYQIGHEDIGEFVSASFELIELGAAAPFCLVKVGWMSNIDEDAKLQEFGPEYLGDGVFLAGDDDAMDNYPFLRATYNDQALMFIPQTRCSFMFFKVPWCY